MYPLVKWLGRKAAGNKPAVENKAAITPNESFYSLAADTSVGRLDFSAFRGRKVLLVNVASGCGYTSQYDELRQLHQQFNEKLAIVGFPANDFKGQEPGTDQEIESFCRINYQIDFPLALKAPVIGPAQQPVYQWLSKKTLNGWNEQAPTWNFCKYLIDEAGVLIQFFPPYVSPLDPSITAKLADTRG